MNSFAFLEKSARHTPDVIALLHGAERYTYREFRDRALAVGGNLRALGCEPGDRVAFCLANSPRIMEIIFGCFAAGLVVVPINARLHAREIAYIVENAGAKILVHGQEYDETIVNHIDLFDTLSHRISTAQFNTLLNRANTLICATEARPEDICWLFYTSGTTGKPKGAIWNHRMVRSVIMNYLADVHNIQAGEMVLHAAPMSHGSGIVALPAVARGATNAIYEPASFDPASLFATVAALRVSHIAFLAPTQIVKMLEDFVPGQHDLSSLKAVCYGGAPIHTDQLEEAISLFGPVFAQIYGQGEAPITITGLNAAAHQALILANDPRLGSAGRVRTDVEARCVDAQDNPLRPGEAGEIVARGDVVMPGYWNEPEASADTLRGGWLHTGDIGYFDEAGYLFLLDRAKDIVISGGNNIYPREVEDVIMLHPDVAACVVFGIPDTYWGESVHAVVVCKAERSLSATEIIAHCANHLAGYKKPKAVDFVSELPVSGYGKVLRREVREPYWKGHASRISGAGAQSVRQ